MKYPIKIEWEIGDGDGQPWNDICATVVEKFGLPGDKYTTEVTNHSMVFNFKRQEDQLMAKLTLGDTGGC